MGRHHNFKLPDHLYLSPPSPQLSSISFSSAVSLLSLKSAPYTFPSTLIQETSTTAFAVGDKIPGFRTSAAFLTTLRANINLDLELSDSQLNTPDSLRPTNLASSVSSLPPHQSVIMADSDFAPPAALDLPKVTLSDDAPTSDAAESQDPNYIPPLSTVVCESDEQRIEALKLVADSVAQQRQLASRAVILHPITLAILVAIAGALYQYFYKGEFSDWAIIGTTFAGVIMTVLVAVRGAAGGYLEEAERVGTWRWLESGRSIQSEEETGKQILGTGDEILLTKFGSEPIGTIIFRGVQPSSAAAGGSSNTTKKSKKQSSGTQKKAEIRAWTVRQKYRHKGVGTALLEDAIRISHEKGWATGGIEFAEDHANHKLYLPTTFNGAMNKRAGQARVTLQKKVEEYESGNSKSGRRKK